MEYYLDTRRKEILPFAATWMDPESIILSEIERERQILYDINLYVESINLNLQKKESRIVVARG